MTQKNRKTTLKEKSENLTDKLNQIPVAQSDELATEVTSGQEIKAVEISAEEDKHTRLVDEFTAKFNEQMEKDRQYQEEIEEANTQLFDRWESDEFAPNDYKIDIPVDSLESQVGYSSLIRQMHDSYTRTIAFYRSNAGGALSADEAREKAFHRCENPEEAKKIFNRVMSYPAENISFNCLHELYGYAPRVAERVWEDIKAEGRAEFETGHLAANTMFPVHYMKRAWNIARYLGIRESFVADWQPKGGIEISLIDMLAQAFFQYQYWLEQTVTRSETEPRKEHHEYREWKRFNERTKNAHSWQEGYWFPPYVHEQAAIEHAVQMADRFNRIFMRTLRQLRDLRRYSPVTINNPNQVNIATDGGKQVNLSSPNTE